MVEAINPVRYREHAIEELQLKHRSEPQRRHFQPEVDPYSYTEILREPIPGVPDPVAVTHFRVRKLCLGEWQQVVTPEIELLRLATKNDLRGVADLLGQEFVRAPNDSKAEVFYMAYRGLDLEQWSAVCRAEKPIHFHPFSDAGFWLQLVYNLLDQVLYPFHALGFVHCDLKPDNVCIPFSEIRIDADDIIGYLDIGSVSLIDLGASVGPIDDAQGRRLHTGNVVAAQADDHPFRYVSDHYVQTREAALQALDGRADLFSLAYWLRTFVLDGAEGPGPWPQARLKPTIRGTDVQRKALASLPGQIWDAAARYGQGAQHPHPNLIAGIRTFHIQTLERIKFRVPLRLATRAQHIAPCWSMLKGYRKDMHLQSDACETVVVGAAPTAVALSAPPEVRFADATLPTPLYSHDKVRQSRWLYLITLSLALFVGVWGLKRFTSQPNEPTYYEPASTESSEALVDAVAATADSAADSSADHAEELEPSCAQSAPWTTVGNITPTVLKGHSGSVASVAFSPDGRRLLSGSSDNTIRLWDVESGENLGVLEGHTNQVTSVVFSPDGRRILSGSQDKSLRLWDANTGKSLEIHQGHDDSINEAVFSADGNRIISGSWDETLRLWDAGNGETLYVLNEHEGPIYSVAFSPDGHQMLSGSMDGTLRLWNADTGETSRVMNGHEKSVFGVVFSPDGRRILSGSGDKTVRLWDVDSGQVIRILRGHEGSVHSVAFSPDGRRLLSGSQDGSLRLWDTDSGDLLQLFRGHDDSFVNSVAFSPDGRRLLSGSGDGMLRLWDDPGRTSCADTSVREVTDNP